MGSLPLRAIPMANPKSLGSKMSSFEVRQMFTNLFVAILFEEGITLLAILIRFKRGSCFRFSLSTSDLTSFSACLFFSSFSSWISSRLMSTNFSISFCWSGV